ncbi:hypothetical protein M0Q97_03555 [Candidatus Dojkabacteria bacterium]|jgi:DNA polymerase elongation subunit (family B)|nr:hypothetical protein [Candidatus Dojkabacteria bacterium]
MIIDYNQKKDAIDISYVSETGQILVEEIILDDEGYFEYVECSDEDPNKISNLKSFHGSSIKKEAAKYFKHHNVNEFFNTVLPTKYPKQFEKLNKLCLPNVYSLDIEVDLDPIWGWSPAQEAKNSIRSISITDEKLNSILFIVKNPEHPEINAIDIAYIDNIISEALTSKFNTQYDYEKQIRIFDTEIDMLNVFLECFNKYFHLFIGWNILDYDWQYIFNRCTNLGISIKKASPTNKLGKKNIEINEKITINLELPLHRLITDYMLLFKESLVYNNLESYSLNNACIHILNIQKVEYEGNLGYLYKNDYLRYVAYAFVDTILVMLLHKITKLLNVEFFQSYYTSVPYNRLSQMSISEALVFKELKKDNMFLLETEKTNNPGRKYKGGYVKAPTKKIINAGHGKDYGSLYPNSMITLGLSPEAKIDKILVDDDFNFINDNERQKWEKYKESGKYCLAPTGNIYDVSKDFLYTRIEKGLLNERKIFKGHMEDIYLNIIPKIENEIKIKTNK